MKVKPTFSGAFLRKITGLLLLCAVLLSWKPAGHPLSVFLEELRLKLDQLSEKNATSKIYLVCDKPLYASGDVVWFSLFARNGNSLLPTNGSATVQLINPQGTVEATMNYSVGPNGESKPGSFKGNFNLKPDQVGGLYKLKATINNNQYYGNYSQNQQPVVFEKEIQVQDVVMPRLKLTLDFEQKAYGPGSTVTAKVKAFTNENRPLSGNGFDFVVSLEGKQVQQAKTYIDKKGNGYVRFRLPENLNSTDGHLNLIFSHEGISESVAKSIPIVLNKVQLSFFPEGGELVNGLQSQLAFRALNEFNKPADISGEVLDGAGNVVASFSSFHDGMGEFSFKPEAGKTYKARLISPAGIKTTYPLPEPMSAGYVLQVDRPEKEIIKVNVLSTISGKAALVGQIRGKIYFEKLLELKPGNNPIELTTENMPIGVMQLTLFDHKTIERAERLVFVNNHKQLQLKIKTDKEKYLPREKVRMTVSASDETGLPMPADIMVSVVDDQLLAYMNDKSSNILSWMLVESEIKGKVEEPKFYFDKEEPKAPVALDLLLKTAGWRRFTWEDVKKVQLQAYRYVGENLLSKKQFKITEIQSPSYYKELSGQVTINESAHPMPNARVKLIQYGRLLQVTSANESGLFRFSNLQSGRYDLEVELDGHKPGLITGIEVQQNSRPYVTISLPSNLPSPVAAPIAKIEKENIKVKYSASKNGVAKLTGRLLDKGNQEPIPFGNVVVKQNGVQKGYCQTDINGNYSISPLAEGTYTVEFPNVGYQTKVINGIKIKNNTNTQLALNISADTKYLNEVEVVTYKAPLIGPDKQGEIITREEIKKLPAANVETIARTANGVFAADDNRGINIRGTRENGTGYYVNGVKQLVAPSLPASATAKPKEKTQKPVNLNAKVLDADNKPAFKESSLPPKQPSEPHNYVRTREFATPVYAEAATVTERTDFRKTLFWAPQVSIGRSGVAVLEFYTGDDITSYNVLAEGISSDGSPGRNEHKFYTQLPFSLIAKLPEATLQNDKISIPLILKNSTGKDVSGKLKIAHPEGWKFVGLETRELMVKANSTNTLYLDYEVLGTPGTFNFGATFEAQGLQDAFTQQVSVEQRGYPISKSIAGSSKEQEYALDISNMTPGTAQVTFSAYPSVVTDLLKGVEGILREPYGCFEQTSSSSYPNLMVLDYLKEQENPDQKALARAEELMDKGYKRLVTFETKDKGYEWFGSVPAHEGLTAYGLLQFTDMKRLGGKVDDAMLKRTQEWMLSRRDGKGGFELSSRALDSYGHAAPEIANAYILYSLAEAGYKDLKKEIDHLCAACDNTNDPYQLALLANALYTSGDNQRAREFLTKLLKLQAADGSWTGTKHSVTSSTGQSLKLETTSLAVLALLKADPKPMVELQNGVKFLLQSRNGSGSFGSTQATILTLKALTAYARASKRTAEDGTVQVFVDRKKAGDQTYVANQTSEIQITELEKHFTKPGNYQVKVQYQKTNNPLPYSMALNYYSNLPPSSPECKVKLETILTASETKVGSTVRYTARIKNLQAEGLPMTMAIIGIPAGMSVQPWQLKELQEKKVIDYYEISGNRLVCYFRGMAPSSEAVVNLDLKAEFPGTYESPAASAYLYYTNEHKHWVPGSTISIKP